MSWMADVGMEAFQNNCVRKLDKKITEVQAEYTINPSADLEEAHLIVLKESATT